LNKQTITQVLGREANPPDEVNDTFPPTRTFTYPTYLCTHRCV